MADLSLLKSAINLQAFVSEYFETRKSGAEFLIVCPWHSDSRPSCRVYEDHLHCYTCQKHADIIDFICAVENLTKGQAIRLLSDRTGISLGPKPTRAARQYDRELAQFAPWWQKYHVNRLQLKLTAYVSAYNRRILGVRELDCIEIGQELTELRKLSGIPLRSHVMVNSTETERHAWLAEREYNDSLCWTIVDLLSGGSMRTINERDARTGQVSNVSADGSEHGSGSQTGGALSSGCDEGVCW